MSPTVVDGFRIGDRVETPGFDTYPRMTVVEFRWRDDTPRTGGVGWWLLCACDDVPGMAAGPLLLHPSWVFKINIIELLAEAVA